jgi:Domain of unknown function (DUF5134)
MAGHPVFSGGCFYRMSNRRRGLAAAAGMGEGDFMTPNWLTAIFAAFMLVVAAVSAARLVAARPWEPRALITDTDIAHLLMAIAMAGALSASLATLPDTAWEVIVGVLTAWFAYRVMRDFRANGPRALAAGHCAPHLVHSASMLYMFLAASVVTGRSGMTGMTGTTGTSGMNGTTGTSGMNGSPAALPMLSHPTLAFVFVLILIGYTVWDLDQLSAAPRGSAALAVTGGPPSGGPPSGGATGRTGRADVAALLAPRTTVACRIVMGVTMALMLVLMI